MSQPTSLFDFDGTLTRHDSLLRFVIFTSGYGALFWHLPQLAWIMVSWKMGIHNAKQSKERILALFYYGWTRERINEAGTASVPEHLRLYIKYRRKVGRR